MSCIECGEYDMEEGTCFSFTCPDGFTGVCLPIPDTYLPSYFESIALLPYSSLAFRLSMTFMEDYTFRLRIHIFAYQNCEMPIFDVDL